MMKSSYLRNSNKFNNFILVCFVGCFSSPGQNKNYANKNCRNISN